jgi:hypothetical protein
MLLGEQGDSLTTIPVPRTSTKYIQESVMPLRLELPTAEEFVLEESDKAFGVSKDSPSKIRIKQADQGAHERRNKLFANVTRELSKEDDSVRITQRFSLEELKRVQVYLTLMACNIEDDAGKPLFEFDKHGVSMGEVAFTKAWSLLPPSIAQEMSDLVIKVNPDWDPNSGN